MIPKVINYCWFGKGEKDETFKKCFESWKKFLPEYQIIEWNESNFNIEKNIYCKEAYEEKKYAFVSDYARLDIIYNNGGIYFDTDVEVLKPLDEIINQGAFIGCELQNQITTGLGFCAERHNFMIKKMLDEYDFIHFREDDHHNTTPCSIYNTEAFKKNGYDGKEIKDIIEIYGIKIYPIDYFSPFNYLTGEENITNHTVTYHHGSASWLPKYERKLLGIKKKLVKSFGKKIGKRIYYIIKFFVLLFNNPKELISKGNIWKKK